MDRDWLEKRVKEAAKTVASWPEWKRTLYNERYSEEARKRQQDEYEVEQEHRRRYSFWP
jgi:hypothetical protein